METAISSLTKGIKTRAIDFERRQKIEGPSHKEKLPKATPNFKYQRIYQLMKGMDKEINHFLASSKQEAEEPLEVAYELFKILKGI